MTQSQHTSGPWVLKDTMKSGHWICNGNSESLYERIAIVDPAPTEEGSENQGKANAHLIAAAPDLLHALEGMVLKHIADHGLQLISAGHPLAQAQTVIAKAKGE